MNGVQTTTIKTDDLDQAIIAAAADAEMLEQLISRNKPYIMTRVVRYAPFASAHEREDLFSAGMIAFYEAVRSYSPEKGHFYPFADIVIRRRVIDEIRKVSKSDAELAVLDEVQEEASEPIPIQTASIEAYEKDATKSELADEIRQLAVDLEEWGTSFEELSLRSPKHTALRDTYAQIINRIADDTVVIDTILRKKYYPVKRINELTGISPKKLERSRIYIVAVMLIINGDYTHLAEYIPFNKKGNQHAGSHR
jgi:RNA polymerase sigma factor